MSPASKEEFGKLTECITKIQHLEKSVEEMKHELKNHKKEGVESQRYISERRLALYLGITSVFASFVGGLIVWLLQRIFP